eukprot:NODE_9542_length_1416_cov_8.296354.p6 GENE.NODE_9542_length_1416_cov_8.296354~~NODE_9542_length_1416_cov_8.296354.p6  ORF type:complete len:61 (+),score=31.67 NODE_9542_length_1416_cov_8.296354:1087-1269(+)
MLSCTARGAGACSMMLFPLRKFLISCRDASRTSQKLTKKQKNEKKKKKKKKKKKSAVTVT